MKFLPRLLFLGIFVWGLMVILPRVPISRAIVASHVVISEIQLASSVLTSDEFVELYNPTDTAINLGGYRLAKKTAAQTNETTLIESMIGIIPAHGFYLLAHQDYAGTVIPDQIYTVSAFSTDNTVLLYGPDSITLVDLVGMGNAQTYEGDQASVPTSGKSIERKALESSTKLSMAINGSDELLGNGWDSDINSSDFIIRDIPQPQNTVSITESSDNITTPTPEPTATPTATPTETPEPTVEPTEIPEPTAIPTLIPTQPPQYSYFPTWSCSKRYVTFKFFNRYIQVPFVRCNIVN